MAGPRSLLVSRHEGFLKKNRDYRYYRQRQNRMSSLSVMLFFGLWPARYQADVYVREHQAVEVELHDE